jgi:hypothetical protein
MKSFGHLISESQHSVGVPELPHGIKGIEKVSRFPLELLLIGLMAAVAVGFILFIWQRRRKNKTLEINRLESCFLELKSLGKVLEGKGKTATSENWFRLTGVVRAILEELLRFPATDLTTAEIGRAITKNTFLSQDEKGFLVDFFSRADLINYAAEDAPADEYLHWLSKCDQALNGIRERAAKATLPSKRGR